MRHTMKELLLDAKKNKYAVAAPNCFNKESVLACFEIASELKSPIILDIGPAMGIEETSAIVDYYEKKFPEVKFALNLDHGKTVEHVVRSVKSGFSSVMIDASTEAFDDNVAITKKVVEIAHCLGVTVEAELGHVGQGINYAATRDGGLTNVEDAIEFVKQTNVDCLAVAVGTSHGVYVGEPKIEFELLKELVDKIDIPLVLHGGSSTGDENLRKAVELGIQKVNLYTDLGKAWIDSLDELINEYKNVDYELTSNEFKNKKRTIQQMIYDSCVLGYKAKLAHYIKLFGSVGRG